MGIIVLLIALALPAFNFITGSRSSEAASNQIAAALGVARAEAIGVQDTRGVAIYHDAASDRDVATIVELRSGTLDAWLAGNASATPPVTYSYAFGQYVIYAGKAYVCTEATVSAAATPAPDVDNVAVDPVNGHWREMSSYSANAALPSIVEVKFPSEVISLPTGIDVRSVGNTVTSNVGTNATDFRYFSPAVVLFDANGQVVSKQFRVLREGVLGDHLGNQYAAGKLTANSHVVPDPQLAGTTLPNPPPAYAAYSGIGLVIYNAEQFKNGTAQFSNIIPLSGSVPKIEDWLDQNATPSMINRFNGTLVKGD